jgi:hypothetical protein
VELAKPGPATAGLAVRTGEQSRYTRGLQHAVHSRIDGPYLLLLFATGDEEVMAYRSSSESLKIFVAAP